MTVGAGPLAGIRVLDLSALAPGPYATMLLGDLGAEVVTIEAPLSARAASSQEDLPHFGGAAARAMGFAPIHRSRRSVVIDLKAPDGLRVAQQLAERADVFIEGFRPGTCDRLGLGYEHVRAIKPDIVYCSLTGYGQTGDLAQRAGHDLNYIAESGLLSALTRPGQVPAIPLNMGADYAGGGLFAAFGIVAALLGRKATGRGTYVDVSMYAGLLSLAQNTHGWTLGGAPDHSWGGGLMSGAVPLYDCYRTADGRWLSVAPLEPKFWRNFCDALQRPDLLPALADDSMWPLVREELTRLFASDTLDGWMSRLADVDTAVAPVRSIPEAFARGRERGLIRDDDSTVSLPSMTGWDAEPGPVVRRPGEHTRDVLGELGYAAEQVDDLLGRAVVAEPDPIATAAAARPERLTS